MKKLKLILAAVVAMVGLSAQAQDWVPVGAGTYQLYNVGADQYFTKGNGWGTQASIGEPMTVELVPVGNDFQIRTYGNHSDENLRLDGVEYLSGGTVYTDQSRKKVSTWTFTNVGTDAEPVYNIISAENHGGGAGTYLTAEGGESTIVGPGTDGTSELAKWKIKAIVNFETTRAGIIATMDAATLDSPVDVTGLIGNASFETADMPIYWAMASSNRNLCGGAASNRCAESYRQPFTLSQTIKNIPNGKYELTAQAAFSGNSGAYIYANDKTSLFVAMTEGENSMTAVSGSFSAGKYTVDPITVIVTDGTLTIGAKTTGNDAWNIWDNFQLKYFGIDLSALQDELASKVAAAQAIAEGTIPTAAYNALNAVVTEYNKTYSTAAGYEEAIGKIDEATTNALALVAPYAAYKALPDKAVFAGVAQETINAQNTAVEEATTVEEIEACTTTLQAAIDALAFDVTSFTIKNPTAQNKDNWEGTDFGGQSNGVCEYWNKSGADFHQTIVNLPAGKYRMTVIALQRLNMTGKVYAGQDSTVIAQVGNPPVNTREQAASWFAAGNGRNYVYFTLAETTDITIGLKADETTGDHWTVWQSFKLDTFNESVAAGYLAPGFGELVQGAQETLEDQAYVNVIGQERTDLEEAIAANPNTVAEYEAAVEALNAAVIAFTAAKTNYDIYAKERALAEAISTEITANIANPTTAEDALVKFRALKVAEYNYVATNYPHSATAKIGEFSTWERTGSVNNNTNVTFEALTSQHWSGDARTYYEQPAGGWSTNANTTWTANYQKVTTLPAGSYVIKVAARAASSTNTVAKITCSAASIEGPIFNFGDEGKGITTTGVASFDEGTFCNDGKGRGWVWNYLPFTLTEPTEVTMTVVAEATGAYQWFSVCDGELFSKTNIADAVAYDETANNTIENVDLANVTMTRTIKEGYNTVVLPFDLTANQVQTIFGSGTEVYVFSENSESANDITINFNKVLTGISANVPVLVKATKATTPPEQVLVFEGVQVVAPTADVKVAGTNASFVGVYAPTTVAEGDYFIGNGKIFKSAGNTIINAFRAYIDVDNTVAKPATVRIAIDGDVVTAIEGLEIVNTNNGKIYNLNGQEVKKAQKGLYIVNGKKVVIK